MRLDYETILRQSFKKSLRGYSEEEVRDFLKIVAKDFKEMKQDLTRLREELNLKDKQVRELDQALAAKPTAKILDAWLGAEGIQYFREHSLREVIKKHIEADASDVDRCGDRRGRGDGGRRPARPFAGRLGTEPGLAS